MRFLAVMMTLLLAAGCAGPGAKNSPTPPAPAPVSETLPPLTEKDLKGRLAIREFRFDADKNEPKVFVQFENLQMHEPLHFEVSTVFRDGNGDIVEQTTWTAIAMEPGARQQYFTKSMRKASASASVEIRMVENKVPGT